MYFMRVLIQNIGLCDHFSILESLAIWVSMSFTQDIYLCESYKFLVIQMTLRGNEIVFWCKLRLTLSSLSLAKYENMIIELVTSCHLRLFTLTKLSIWTSKRTQIWTIWQSCYSCNTHSVYSPFKAIRSDHEI